MSMSPAFYALLADIVLVAHFTIMLFIVGGLTFVVIGGLRGWPSARSWTFRVAHLAAIGVVVAQGWLSAACPLTILEVWLRTEAGMATYEGGFIAHWVQRAIYFDAPAWVFTLAYTLFALGVLAAWWLWPPRAAGRSARSERHDAAEAPRRG